ncbi:DsbA family protein [Cognaticolwellia mytili]|uniref:DsbA family protein n=1 Tax=Cognaticolwellia mytili TaxID=1888913 RepID=UPI000A16EB33|nr:DsbA family protein [Cognaticolwellia mytili]
MKAKLYYVYDPMCSWCWGYNATWDKLQSELTGFVDIHYCLGGLAEDSEKPMPAELKIFLQRTWHKISQQLGTEFNFDFWEKCQPKRSTYPACRAILIARAQNKEREMLIAIQQGYYLQARNPSEQETLQELAEEAGVNISDFFEKMTSELLQEQLMSEIYKVRTMPINGFPSLILYVNNEYLAIPIDYKNWRTSFDAIIKNI